MVLDIRYLRFPDGEDALQDEALPTIAADDSLEQLLERAVRGSTPKEQARAVEQLRQIIPNPEGVELLWEILASEGDPRRLLAAQLLGHQRQWLSERFRLKQLLDLARRERDAAVGSALVWCLRQRDEICVFLRHQTESVAREAALGLPVNGKTLPHLLKALLTGPKPGSRPEIWSEIERVLLSKLRSIHPSLVRDLLNLLLEREWDESGNRLISLFECLPQLPLFEFFLEERQLPGWNPQQEADATRARSWQQCARTARQVLEQKPTRELLRHLLARSGEDEAFARHHGQFLRGVMHGADPDLDLITHFERLTFRAAEEKVARLAQLLVELSGRLEGEAGAQAASLLEDWKSRSPDLRLKIYHLQLSR